MGKLRKQLSGKTGPSPKIMATADLERNAAADLGRQNFSRAKEWLKELCKRDRERYLPQLIACYEGLAAQMSAQGRHHEARVVREQIRQIAGEREPARETAAPKEETGGGDVFAAAAAAVLTKWGGSGGPAASGNVTPAEDGAGPPRPAGDAARPRDEADADALVIAFTEIPRFRETFPEAHRECLAVQQALSLVSAGDFDAALREAKTIRRQSVFAPWRLFITGLCAFYTHHDDRAREAFSRIPGNSLTFRASRPYLFILETERPEGPRPGAKESLLVNACRILRHPELDHVLPRAEFLWQTGRPVDSCRHVFRSAKHLFEADGPLGNTLARFYLHAALLMAGDTADLYLQKIAGFVGGQGFRSGDIHLARIRALGTPRDPVHYRNYLQKWEEYRQRREALLGRDDRISALVSSHMGDFLFSLWQNTNGNRFPIRSPRGRQSLYYSLALAKYRESLDLYPGDRDVHLKILELYDQAGATSERNKKLDEITRLFPDDRDVLVKNGSLCIKRKAFLKGIGYLKRALILNPLEGRVREYLILGCISAALQSVSRGNNLRYREFMQDAMEAGEPGLHNMNLCHPYILLRWAAMEWITGQEERGDELYRDALDRGDNNIRLVYFTYLIISIYGTPPLRPFNFLEKQVKEIFKTPSPSVAAAITEIMYYVRQIDPRHPRLRREFDRLKTFAMKAVTLPCTVEEAKSIVSYAYAQPRKEWGLIKAYTDKILRSDPRHPWFLYFRLLHSRRGELLYAPRPQDLAALEEILALAVERHDRFLVEKLNKIIVNMKKTLAPAEEDDDPDDCTDLGDRKFRKIMEEIEAIINMEASGRRGRRAGKRLEKKLREANQDDRQAHLFDEF